MTRQSSFVIITVAEASLPVSRMRITWPLTLA